MREHTRSTWTKWLIAGCAVVMALGILGTAFVAANWDTYGRDGVFGTSVHQSDLVQMQAVDEQLKQRFGTRLTAFHLDLTGQGQKILSLDMHFDNRVALDDAGSAALAENIARFIRLSYKLTDTVDQVVIRLGNRPYAFAVEALQGAGRSRLDPMEPFYGSQIWTAEAGLSV